MEEKLRQLIDETNRDQIVVQQVKLTLGKQGQQEEHTLYVVTPTFHSIQLAISAARRDLLEEFEQQGLQHKPIDKSAWRETVRKQRVRLLEMQKNGQLRGTSADDQLDAWAKESRPKNFAEQEADRQSGILYVDWLLPSVVYTQWDPAIMAGKLLVQNAEDRERLKSLVRNQGVANAFRTAVLAVVQPVLQLKQELPNSTAPEPKPSDSQSEVQNGSGDTQDPSTTNFGETSTIPSDATSSNLQTETVASGGNS